MLNMWQVIENKERRTPTLKSRSAYSPLLSRDLPSPQKETLRPTVKVDCRAYVNHPTLE